MEQALSSKRQSPSFSWFVAESQELVLRVQFASSNNYTAPFWKAFKRGLQAWDKTLAVRLADMPFPQYQPEFHRLLNILAQTADNKRNAIFVFEGVQYLKDGPIRDLVSNLAGTHLEGLSVILIDDGFVDIGFQADLRTAKSMNRSQQLSREEIRLFYTALGIVVDDEFLDSVWKVTDGWETAVCLVSNHLPRGERLGKAALDNAVTCTYEAFSSSLFAPQTRDAQHALILLSLLDSFTMELAVALTALSPDDLLELSARLFVKDSGREHTYRFHSMYHQWLKTQQFLLSREQKQAFFEESAAWYEDHGGLLEALQYYAEGGCYRRMVQLLQTMPLIHLRQEEAYRVASVLDTLPCDVMAGYPELKLCQIIVLHYAGGQSAAHEMYSNMLRELSEKACTPAEKRVLGELLAMDVCRVCLLYSDAYMECLRRACHLLPQGSAYFDVDILYVPGSSELRIYQQEIGDLSRIEKRVLSGLPYIRKLFPKTGAGRCYLALAEYHMQRMEFDEVREYAQLAIHAGVYSRMWGIVCEANCLLSRICILSGELEDFLYYCDQIAVYAQKRPAGTVKMEYTSKSRDLQIALMLMLDHLMGDWLLDNPMENNEMAYGVNISGALFIHVLRMVLIDKRYQPALSLIETAIAVYQRNGMWGYRLKLIILKAIAYHALNKLELACNCLLDAYEMSRDNDFLFPYVEYGQVFADLAAAVRDLLPEDAISDGWLDRSAALAVAFEKNRAKMADEYIKSNPIYAKHCLEHLSRQEYTVLEFLCAGLSTQDMAGRMGVQPATIHTYLYRMYKKIGASGREEAVQIAHREGMPRAGCATHEPDAEDGKDIAIHTSPKQNTGCEQ